ncbi:GNAT family N-acetyltransferase [Pontibacter sp. KCTC 32443]|uniref:GNAT family N-acetyltransferase n=1 Tax=Pontibacter TaxID=323449 RepID=UPI00164DD706|nr:MULTISPECIES: GNAT family protein [Pontibacter]MBC5775134.1 GNAT family N-acetyltransferase [Pontibacter sp. KCTC 32443]
MNFEKDLYLEDDHVLLRPIKPGDLEQLQPIALDADTWRWYVTRIANIQDLEEWAQAAFNDRRDHKRYPFVIVDKATGKLAASTAYGNISAFDKRLEIGWTWLGEDFRSTGLNRHCKFLLLSYAFDVLQYERVELKTDVLNIRSRKAILKIGATEEGTLRSHMLMHNGRRRDTIYYSILRPEWPAIKATIFTDLTFTCTQV